MNLVGNRFLAASSIAAAISAPAWAKANWAPFFTVSSGAKMYVDTTSMKLSAEGKVWTVWIKTEFSTVKQTTLESTAQQLSIDCPNDTFKLGTGAMYYRDGAVGNLSGQMAKAIIPDTPPAELRDLLCIEAESVAAKN